MNLNEKDRVLEMLKNNTLELDDTFSFDCDRCGKCCRNREDILLNAKDLYRLCRYLGLTAQEFIGRYCEMYIGEASRIPVLRLLPRQYRQTCPLLGKDGCTDAVKPVVCALFPLGRALKHSENRIVYFTQGETCGKGHVTHTLREWLDTFGLEYQDEDAIRWFQLTGNLAKTMHRVEAMLDKTLLAAIRMAMLHCFYLDYDYAQPFTPQFKRNEKLLRQFLCAYGVMEDELQRKSAD